MKLKTLHLAKMFCLIALTFLLSACSNSDEHLRLQDSAHNNAELEKEPDVEVDEAKIKEFWDWFHQNEERLAELRSPTDPRFQEIVKKLQDIDLRLKAEIGVARNGQRYQLAISPELNPALFPAARKVAAAAPASQLWDVVPFCQRLRPNTLRNLELSNSDAEQKFYFLSIRDLRYQMKIDEQKANIVILIRNYKPDDSKSIHYQDMALLMLQQALGEYDLCTKVGNVSFEPLDENTAKNFKPLEFISRELDEKLPYTPKL